MSDLTTTFTNIANAIRSKTGSSDTMTPSEMPNEIAEIETPMDSINITQNGTYEPSAGRGYNQVIVEVPEPTLISKSITENGTYNASEDNADGYSQVTVAVEGFKKKSIANTPTDIASFDDGTANPMPSLEISIVPQQDLHGYDNPWVGGAGKNKIVTLDRTFTNNNVICVCSSVDETVSLKGTAGSSGGRNMKTTIDAVLPAGTYFLSATSVSGTIQANYIANKTSNNEIIVGYNNTFTLEEETSVYIGANVTRDTVYDEVVHIQIEPGRAATSWTPYSNICPIDGHTEADVTVADDVDNPTVEHTISILFLDFDNPIMVYEGTLNITSGELTATHANIASYNGETINEPWISSMDVYSAGVTPTTGAQVVYPLATPITYQLTPAQVTTLLGQNNIFADCGQILQGEYFVTL